MALQQKKDCVKKQLRRGNPAGEIKSSLLQEDFTEQEIKEMFGVHKYDMRSWYLLFAVLFLLIGFVVFLKGYGILLLLFSTALFISYYLEQKRQQKNEA
jgi:hypothetical protein